jgi:hypothetical protein
VPIDDLAAAGLPKASVIRPAKITTVEASRCEPRGRLTAAVRQQVEAVLLAGLR